MTTTEEFSEPFTTNGVPISTQEEFRSGEFPLTTESLADDVRVECCSDNECHIALGLNSYCGDPNPNAGRVCLSDDFPRKKRGISEPMTTLFPLPEFPNAGRCACRLGYWIVDSSCQPSSDVTDPPACCSDTECHNLQGQNSHCDYSNADVSSDACPTSAPTEGPVTEPVSPFEGTCRCDPGFSLVNEECVSDIMRVECCSNNECHIALGLNSYCGDPNPNAGRVCLPEGFPRKKRGISEPMTTLFPLPEFPNAGLCACRLGYWIIDSSCQPSSDVTEPPACCSDTECHNLQGQNSHCNYSYVDFSSDACPTSTPTEGPVTEPVSPFEGTCRCDSGFSLVNEECVSDITPSVTDIEGSTSSPIIFNHSHDDPLNQIPDSSRATDCHVGTCHDGDCTLAHGIPNSFCLLNGPGNCYVTKQCADDGFNYILGCEDPCANLTSSGSHGCYSATCQTLRCNNQTSLVDDFQCDSAEYFILSFNLLLIGIILHTF